MRMPIAIGVLGSAGLGLPLAACTADIHDNTADVHDNTANIDDAQVAVSTVADTDNVHPGQAVRLLPIDPTAESA